MRQEDVQVWLDRYIAAWSSYDEAAIGDLFMAIRVAVTGRTATPPLFDTLVALGRDRTLARLDGAIATLGDAAPVGP